VQKVQELGEQKYEIHDAESKHVVLGGRVFERVEHVEQLEHFERDLAKKEG
jgi:hypothetical protein